MKKIATPHDTYFRAMMEDLEVAIAFFQAHSPKELVAAIDWTTLKIYDSARRFPGRKTLYTDITYHCLTQDTRDDVFLHGEQERGIDGTMLERMLQYNAGQYAKYRGQGHRKLPIIANFVVYNGIKEAYPYSEDLYDYFTRPDLARVLMSKPFILVNLNKESDEQLASHGLTGLMELFLKRAPKSDFLAWMRMNKSLLRGFPADRYVNPNIDYVCQAGEYEIEEVVDSFVYVYPELKEMIMTALKRLEQKVEMRVRESAMETKAMEIAKNMLLQLHLDMDTVHKATGLSKEELEKLQKGDPKN